jgi:Zn-dependent protease with chaperone function
VIGQLGFLLGVAAAMAIAGALSSLLTALAWPLVSRLPADRRADASLAMALLPAVSALTLGLAVSLPSLRHALGLGADHCAEHLHHAHLCWLHGSDLPPSLAALGATALAVFAARAPWLAAWRTARLSTALERVSQRREDLVWVPGSSRVCHVSGVLSPRIYVSEALTRELSTESLQAMLEHERAHVARRDPMVGLALSWASAFGLPLLADSWRVAWRQAAEEAADARAAQVHGPLVVASALVEFARLQQEPAPGLGFGAVGLEARVLRLVDAPAAPRPALALPLLALASVLGVLLAFGFSDPLHHLVEDLAHALSHWTGTYYR